MIIWKIWLDHVRDDVLKFNKGRTSVLRNLVQRLKSGAEHEDRLTFLVLSDDYRTVTDAIADITLFASRSRRIEKLTTPIEWWRYRHTSVDHRTWFMNLSQVKVTNMLSTLENQMSWDRDSDVRRQGILLSEGELASPRILYPPIASKYISQVRKKGATWGAGRHIYLFTNLRLSGK